MKIAAFVLGSLLLASVAQAQTCQVLWDNGDARATHTRVYVGPDPAQLRTDPNTLALEVPVTQTEVDCSAVGLTDRLYVAVDHRDGSGNESPLSSAAQLTLLGAPGNVRIQITFTP
jgi:hypothetical protein